MANKCHNIDGEWHQEKTGDSTKTHCDRETANALSVKELQANRKKSAVAMCATCKAAYVV